jgi:BioD-like phosphotransacetylase family protein
MSETKRTNVSKEDFVTAVVLAHKNEEGLKGISARTNLKLGSVISRLSSYRKKGINLPTFKGGGNHKLNVDALNEFVKTIS